MPRRTAIAIALLLTTCKPLIDLDFGSCGNGLVEPDLGEACDTAVDLTLGHRCGPPSVPSQACQYICGSAGGQCPAGWVCGDDEVCMHAITEFEPISGAAFGSDLLYLQSADFDGDGRRDLIASTGATATLEFNDGRGGFTDPFDLPLPHNFEPALSDLDGDGRTDVTIGFEALYVFTGQADRQVLPAGIGTPFSEVFETSGLDILGIGIFDADEYIGSYFRVPEGVCITAGCEGDGVALLPEEAALSPEALVWASTASTATVAVAFKGASELLIFTEPDPRRPGGPRPRRVTRVPSPRPLLGRLELLDGDLLAQIESEDSNHADAVLRVRRDGRGGYETTVEDLFEDFLCLEDCQPVPPDGPPQNVFPLAVGDFNDDGLSDIVTPLGFVVQNPRGTFTSGPRRFDLDDYHRLARVSDINGDGHLDMVTAARLRQRLEVWTGDGKFRFVVTPLAVRSTPEQLFLADFDSDGLDEDIAFIEKGQKTDFLTVLYNNAPRFETKRFPILGDVESAIAVTPPGTEAVVVITVAPEGQAPRALLQFQGTTYQLMMAPLILPRLESRHAALGYVGTPRLDDAFGASLLGSWEGSDGTHLWRRDGGRRLVREPVELTGTECPDIDVQPCLDIIHDRLRPDSPDETLVMLVLNQCRTGEVAPRIITASQNTGDGALTCASRPIDPVDSPFTYRLRVADLDGTGPYELVMLVPGELRIFWDFEAQGLVTSTPIDAEDFVVMNIDDDPAMELIGFVPGRAQRFEIEDRELRLAGELALEAAQDGRLVRAIADDFTGDGLTDVVVANGLRYTLYRSISSRERR